MQPSRPTPDLDSPPGTAKPLPLFRAEALAAQQQKFYGEILLIRPLSLALLGWLGTGISLLVLGFLLLGHYTEKITVSGVIAGSGSNNTVEADLYVPGRALGFVHRGGTIQVRCRTCTHFSEQTAIVEQISPTTLGPNETASQANMAAQELLYKVKVALSSKPDSSWQSGSKIDAVVVLGRKPLLAWLFFNSSKNTARAQPGAPPPHDAQNRSTMGTPAAVPHLPRHTGASP